MRTLNLTREEQIQRELLNLFQRIDTNADNFGMSPEEVALIKQKCALAYRHKIILDKISMPKSK